MNQVNPNSFIFLYSARPNGKLQAINLVINWYLTLPPQHPSNKQGAHFNFLAISFSLLFFLNGKLYLKKIFTCPIKIKY
jgi:hypothetical protein